MSDFIAKFQQDFIESDRYLYLLRGLGNTLLIAALAVILGIVLGFLVAIIRSTHDKHGGLNILNFICKVYLTIWRGTPTMVQLLIMSMVIFANSRNFTMVGALTLGINSGAYVSEIIRGGLMAVDAGQMEAARSLGMTHWQAMRKVVFPQAIKNSLPAIGNEFIINIKDSSVLCVVGVSDLMFMTRSVAGIYYKGTECYLIAAIVYLFLTYLSSLLLKAITGKMTAPDNTKRHQGNQTVDLGLPSSN